MSHSGSLRGFVPGTTGPQASWQHITRGDTDREKPAAHGEMASVHWKLLSLRVSKHNQGESMRFAAGSNSGHTEPTLPVSSEGLGIYTHIFTWLVSMRDGVSLSRKDA